MTLRAETSCWLILIVKLETVSIAEPLQNRQHARKTPNAVNTRIRYDTMQ